MAKDLKSEGLKDGATISQRILRTTMLAVAHNNSNFRSANTDAPVPTPMYNDSNYDTSSNNDIKKLYNNIFLCLSIIMIAVAVFVYCSFIKNYMKRHDDSLTQRRPRPNDDVAETITSDAMQRSERSTSQSFRSKCFVLLEPPPTYESIFDPQAVPSPLDRKYGSNNFDIIAQRTGSFSDELEANWINKQKYIPRDDQELPSYEAALKLEANGYV